MSKETRFMLDDFANEIWDEELQNYPQNGEICETLNKQDETIAELKQQLAEKDKEIERLKLELKEKEGLCYVYSKLAEAKSIDEISKKIDEKNLRHQICEKIRHRALLLYDNCPDHKIERMYGVRKCLLDKIEEGE